MYALVFSLFEFCKVFPNWFFSRSKKKERYWFVHIPTPLEPKDGVEKGDIYQFSLGRLCLPWKSWYGSNDMSHEQYMLARCTTQIYIPMHLAARRRHSTMWMQIMFLWLYIFLIIIRCIYSNKSYAATSYSNCEAVLPYFSQPSPMKQGIFNSMGSSERLFFFVLKPGTHDIKARKVWRRVVTARGAGSGTEPHWSSGWREVTWDNELILLDFGLWCFGCLLLGLGRLKNMKQNKKIKCHVIFGI